MIRRLRIRSFALIDDLLVELGGGLNVMTGETGAGKSIIIGALGLLLGERARVETIRSGCDRQSVEGLFDLPPALAERCRSMGIALEGSILLLQREVGSDGRSKATANGSAVPLSLLKKVGDGLIDLHGQHQHQSLLQVETHIDVLDQFGELWPDRTAAAESFRACAALQQQLRDLAARAGAARENEELRRFQRREIDEVDPAEGEEERLEQERQILESSEHLYQAAEQLFQSIHQSEGSIIERLGSLRPVLASMVQVDPRLKEQMTLFDDGLVSLQALSEQIMRYRDRIEFDPGRLEEIRDRLGAFSRLKRKYGGSMEQVLAHRRAIEEHLADLDDFENRLAAIQTELRAEEDRFRRACLALSKKREAAAARLEKLVERELAQLGMKKVIFRISRSWVEDEGGSLEVDQQRYRADQRGLDCVEFFIAPNLGEEPRPLAKIASGGEISRIMLALKSALASREGIPTMVFDEIDIGIGGRVAEVVGEKLKRLAEQHQIICITHLPQIASLSQEHYAVAKKVRGGRTVTTITHLTAEQKVEEIARLLGGATITPVVRKHAREMVERAAAK